MMFNRPNMPYKIEPVLVSALNKMNLDKDSSRIGRPRQVYNGIPLRPFLPIEDRR